MRRLPVYILLDTSGSMRGEPIEAVRSGLHTLVSSLMRDPYALETVHLSIITFDREARLLSPLTELGGFQIPAIPDPETSPTNLGEALEMLVKQYDSEVVKTTVERKGDWLPIAFIMTDGSPSDTQLYGEMLVKVKARKFGKIIGCAVGSKAKVDPLRALTSEVVIMDTMDSSSFAQFFVWMSEAVSSQSKSTVIDASLPPPPPEIHLVL